MIVHNLARAGLSTTTLLVCLTAGHAAAQTTLYDANFDNLNVGDGFGAADTKFSGTPNTTSSSTATVTDLVSNSGDNSLVLQRFTGEENDDEFLQFLRESPADDLSSGVLSINYAFRYEANDVGPIAGIAVTDETSSDDRNFLGAGLFVDPVFNEVLFFDPNDESGSGFGFLGVVSEDIFYDFSIDIDLDNRTVGYSVSGGDLENALVVANVAIVEDGFRSADAFSYTTQVCCDFGNDPVTAYFDDVTVTIPEPTSAALLAGVGGVLAMRRRSAAA